MGVALFYSPQLACWRRLRLSWGCTPRERARRWRSRFLRFQPKAKGRETMLASIALAFALQASSLAPPPEPPSRWAPAEADFIAHNVRFGTGETMAQVRIHYATLGRAHRNRNGEIDNAILLLHGTGGAGHQFLQPQFADELFGRGQPLDIERYWIIMPDNIGHGGSAKPSDGLRMRFP